MFLFFYSTKNLTSNQTTSIDNNEKKKKKKQENSTTATSTIKHELGRTDERAKQLRENRDRIYGGPAKKFKKI